MTRLKHAPIVRYIVSETVPLIQAGKVRLQKFEDGHAEVLGGNTGSEALGWLSAKQVVQVEERLRAIAFLQVKTPGRVES